MTVLDFRSNRTNSLLEWPLNKNSFLPSRLGSG
jgi:hypothetical protein